MTNADLLADAVDTLWALGWAFLAWIAAAALLMTVALYTAGAAVWAVCRAVRKTARRRTAGPSWARGALRARWHARTRARRSSGHAATHDYQEAA